MSYTKSNPIIIRKGKGNGMNPTISSVVNKIKEVIPNIIQPKEIVKDWEAAKEKEIEIRALSQKIDEDIKSLIYNYNKMTFAIKEAIQMVPKTDGTLYFDSLLSPTRLFHNLRCYMFKEGFPDRHGITKEKIDIRSFSKEVEDGLGWLFKYRGQK